MLLAILRLNSSSSLSLLKDYSIILTMSCRKPKISSTQIKVGTR